MGLAPQVSGAFGPRASQTVNTAAKADMSQVSNLAAKSDFGPFGTQAVNTAAKANMMGVTPQAQSVAAQPANNMMANIAAMQNSFAARPSPRASQLSSLENAFSAQASAVPASNAVQSTDLSSVPGAYSNTVDTSGYTDFTSGAQKAVSGDMMGAFTDAVNNFGLGTAMQMAGMFTGGSRAPLSGRSDMDRGGSDRYTGEGLLGSASGSATPAPPAPTYPGTPDWWQNWRQNYGQFGLLGPRPVATII